MKVQRNFHVLSKPELLNLQVMNLTFKIFSFQGRYVIPSITTEIQRNVHCPVLIPNRQPEMDS